MYVVGYTNKSDRQQTGDWFTILPYWLLVFCWKSISSNIINHAFSLIFSTPYGCNRYHGFWKEKLFLRIVISMSNIRYPWDIKISHMRVMILMNGQSWSRIFKYADHHIISGYSCNYRTEIFLHYLTDTDGLCKCYDCWGAFFAKRLEFIWHI